jgi:hypothetical protein
MRLTLRKVVLECGDLSPLSFRHTGLIGAASKLLQTKAATGRRTPKAM